MPGNLHDKGEMIYSVATTCDRNWNSRVAVMRETDGDKETDEISEKWKPVVELEKKGTVLQKSRKSLNETLMLMSQIRRQVWSVFTITAPVNCTYNICKVIKRFSIQWIYKHISILYYTVVNQGVTVTCVLTILYKPEYMYGRPQLNPEVCKMW